MSGALVFSQDPVDVIERGASDRETFMQIVPNKESNTLFLAWSKYLKALVLRSGTLSRHTLNAPDVGIKYHSLDVPYALNVHFNKSVFEDNINYDT